MQSPGYIGFHAAYYVPIEEIAACKDEILRLYTRIKMGDSVTPLERLALGLLQVNHTYDDGGLT